MTITEWFKQIIKRGASSAMTVPEFLRVEVDAWLKSDARKSMLTGVRYYKGQNDILERRRYSVGDGGEAVPDRHMANNRIPHAFLRKLIDQKAEYLMGREFTLTTTDGAAQSAIEDVFDKATRRMIKQLCVDAGMKGIAWAHPYYDREGLFKIKAMPAEEMIPLWSDAAHTQLDAMIRVYDSEVYEGKSKAVYQRVELWDAGGVQRYIAKGHEALVPDIELGERGAHLAAGDDERPINWERIPFVAFKYNRFEQPLIEFVKALVDDYDRNKSDHSNELEDLLNFVYVLHNYDGTDLGEFRRNLAHYRAIKVSGDGGVDTLASSPDTEAFTAHQMATRKDIYEFGRGVDNTDTTIDTPSGIALRFMYADLDLDCSGIEGEFQAGLEQLMWFVFAHLANSGAGDFEDAVTEIVFNKDIPVNETDVITNARNSVGLISGETIVEQHPWVTDPKAELRRMKAEQEAAMEQMDAVATEQDTDGE